MRARFVAAGLAWVLAGAMGQACARFVRPNVCAVAGAQQLPPSPLGLKPPAAPACVVGGVDLRALPAARLADTSDDLYLRGEYDAAISHLHYALISGAGSAYNLACYYALVGQAEAAFYWLERAALEEGVDAHWANQDSDLELLRRDPRWTRVKEHLAQTSAYWAAKPGRATVVVPSGYAVGTPIGVLLGLHPQESCGAEFVRPETYQRIADELQMAVVAVNGTLRTGKCRFAWSEDAVRDAAHVRRELAAVSDQLTPDPDSLIVFGVFQGAQMGFEIAFANPGEYRGAVVFSPGSIKEPTLRELHAQPANAKQRFVCTCGADEPSGNVSATLGACNFAKNGRARVEVELYEGVASNALPSDFAEVFPRWVRFIATQS
jgi:predicted esterase